MALSLDYIGKFLIVMVTVSVAITLIINFQGDLEMNLPWEEEDGDTDIRIVELDGGDELNQMTLFIDNCQERSLRNPQTSFECFLITHTDGGFPDIDDDLDEDDWDEVVNIEDLEDAITVKIEYNIQEGGVVVEKIN